MKRVEVPPDGHCIIHSWRMGLAAQGAKMEQEQILKLGVAEISANLGFYGEFLPDEDLKCTRANGRPTVDWKEHDGSGKL